MTDSGGKGDARSLVSSVLSRVSDGQSHKAVQDGDPADSVTEDGPPSPTETPSLPGEIASPGGPSGNDAPSLPEASSAVAALAGSILAKLGGPSDSDAASPPQGESPPAPAVPQERDVHALIEVYFELEEPEERDVLFDELTAIRSPLIDDFLFAMMQEDEDDYVRSAAAAEMARRGNRDALARLEADLDDPEEMFFFEHAVQVLGQIHGVGFYDRLSAIWKDELRDGDQRREVMLGMEALDLERALADFRRLVDDSVDIQTMPDDQIEVALMAFIRHTYSDALPSLDQLLERIRAADIDADEKLELMDFVREGMGQLASQD